MDIYLYVDRDTWVHRLDPRPKFFLVLATLLLAVVPEHPVVPALLMALALLTIHAARAWSSLRRVRTLLVAIFTFTTVVWTLFAQGATPLIGFVEREPLLFAVSTGLKLTATITASVAWLSSTRNEEITTGFIRMGVPYRLAFAFSSALRMVPTFVGAGVTIIEAQKARGVDVESGNVLTRVRKHLPLMVPVFVSALRSAQQLAIALESKGFGAQSERTYLLELRMRPQDWMATSVGVAGVAVALWIVAANLARIPGLIR